MWADRLNDRLQHLTCDWWLAGPLRRLAVAVACLAVITAIALLIPAAI